MTSPNETMLAIVEQIEALEGGRQAVAKQIADLYRAARRFYKLDRRAIKAVVRHRADPVRATELRALVDRYLAALAEAKERLAHDLLRAHGRVHVHEGQGHPAHEDGPRSEREAGAAPPSENEQGGPSTTTASGTLDGRSAWLAERVAEASRARELKRQIAEFEARAKPNLENEPGRRNSQNEPSG